MDIYILEVSLHDDDMLHFAAASHDMESLQDKAREFIMTRYPAYVFEPQTGRFFREWKHPHAKLSAMSVARIIRDDEEETSKFAFMLRLARNRSDS